MKIRALVLAIATLATVASAHAAIQTADYGSYTVSYDDSTIFGGPTSNHSGDGGSVGFGWSIPTSVSVNNYSSSMATFQLPDFTISANSGWKLSGPFSANIGNLVFFEAGGATTDAFVIGSVSVDGASSTSFGQLLNKTVTSLAPELSSGYFSGSASLSQGQFSTLSITGGTLTLTASGLPMVMFGAIAAQPQNTLSFGFVAAPVPEPESYAMLLAGLAVVGTMARRRRHD